MIRRPPRSTRTDTLFPCTTLFRSGLRLLDEATSGIGEGGELEGEIAFRLYDTFGFPYDLTEDALRRSEEHTSELQSLMRISYAVFCLKKTTTKYTTLTKPEDHTHQHQKHKTIQSARSTLTTT